MRIVQTVIGVFHHFELARQLERRAHLETIYSTFPWKRLKREGLAKEKVKTFPWIHPMELMLLRSPLNWTWATDQLSYANLLAFDTWLDGRVERAGAEALIAISGVGLKTGRHLQQRGGIFICDRGSTHQRYQERIISEEYARWGVDRAVSDIRDTLREEEMYAAADAITVPSQVAARSFVAMGVAAEKVHVIPYGVRLENFSPVAAPPPERFEVLFVGQASLRKGVPYLLEAFARLQHPAKRLRIVGSMHPSLKDVLRRLPTEHVEFLGSVPQARMPELMSTSHVMVLPSIEEGLALVQGQALACGCPLICSANSGGEDLMTDGVEGFVVPIRDAGAILDRLERLAADPELRARMSVAALARVSSIGGWNEYGDRWEALLKNLVRSQ